MDEEPAKLEYPTPVPQRPVIENGVDVIVVIVISLVMGGCVATLALCVCGLLRH